MTDDEFLQRFEAQELDPGEFSHASHVRLAFVYLSRFDLFDSIGRYRKGLRAFAARAGVPGKYHETVTCGLMVLIHERMVSREADDWEGFIEENPDLLRWMDGPFFDYYDESVLRSSIARRTFVLPTRRGRNDSSY